MTVTSSFCSCKYSIKTRPENEIFWSKDEQLKFFWELPIRSECIGEVAGYFVLVYLAIWRFQSSLGRWNESLYNRPPKELRAVQNSTPAQRTSWVPSVTLIVEYQSQGFVKFRWKSHNRGRGVTNTRKITLFFQCISIENNDARLFSPEMKRAYPICIWTNHGWSVE